MKNKIKIVSIILVSIVLIPQIALASWWNPVSWFKKSNNVYEMTSQNTCPPNSTFYSQGSCVCNNGYAGTGIECIKENSENSISQNIETKAISEQKPIATGIDTQSSSTQTTKELQAEIKALQINLDALYKAHNNLVAEHNDLKKDFKGLIEITTAFRSEIENVKNTKTNVSSSDFSSRISVLDEKLDTLCQNIFSLTVSCPLGRIGSTLEDRIRTLERK